MIMPEWLKAVLGSLAAAFIGITGAVIRHLWSKQKQQSARQTAIEDGMLALLHDRIYGEYAACEHKGFASVEDIRNLEYLYRPYHALGGNGTGTELFERVKRMPDRPAEQEEANA